MPTWNDGKSHWNSGVRWLPAVPRIHTNMASIALNTSRLSLGKKIEKGQVIITASTDNPSVPGNQTALAAFVASQLKLVNAINTVESAQQAFDEAVSARDDALAEWDMTLTGLAGVTENITQGEKTKLLSAGFDVKAAPATPQPMVQVQNVRVSYTGNPGYSEVRWRRVPGAVAYVIECSPDPLTPGTWKNMGTVGEVKYIGNGATPGQPCWYRVAAVRGNDQGPWSEPALRAVL